MGRLALRKTPLLAALGAAARALRPAGDLQVVLGPNIDDAVAQLGKFERPVILDEVIEYYETDEETQKEKKICSAKLLADGGVRFALSLGISGPTAYPWWQLGTCVRNGVDRRVAIEALTTVPAKILGLEDQVGSLGEGKLGNVQILTGDPLQATTWVETVLLEGEVVYERAKDPRLQYLFAEDKDRAKKAAGPDKPADKKDKAATEAPAAKEAPAPGKAPSEVR